jgi:hypothetical protein
MTSGSRIRLAVWGLCGLAALVGGSLPSANAAEAAAFTGTWLNISPKTAMVTQIEIGIFKTVFTVHAWGNCTPMDCDWGTVNVPIPLRLGETFTAKYDFGYGTDTLTITLVSANSLHVHEFMDYTPLDGRTDFEKDEYFYREGSGKVLPDLVVTGLTIPKSVVVYHEVPWTWVTITVKNLGPGVLESGALRAELSNCTINGEPYTSPGYFTIAYSAPLYPGQTATHEFAVGHASGWPVGVYSIRVKVDPDDTISEADERNNLSAKLAFDVANERFLAGTIRYNGNPLSNYTQVYPVSIIVEDWETFQYLDGYFFWYDTQTGHYLLSGLPESFVAIWTRFHVSGPNERMADNYTTSHFIDLRLLSDAQANNYDIDAQKIMHLLTPWDNSQVGVDFDLGYPTHCSKTEFTWEPLEGAVKYRIDIDINRDTEHPSGYGLIEHIVVTEITETTYTTDLPVLPDLLHYEIGLEGYNDTDQRIGYYESAFLDANGDFGSGVDYRFKVCPACGRGDINRDCQVNMLDLAIMAEEWLVDTR